MKQCTKCKTAKELKFFYKRPSGKFNSWCRVCNSESSKAPRKSNKEYHNKSAQDWYKHGVTLKKYNRLLEKQKWACGICFAAESAFKKKFAIDRCHQTGKVRGLLCERCNKGIGHFSDSTTLLNNAILYLGSNL